MQEWICLTTSHLSAPFPATPPHSLLSLASPTHRPSEQPCPLHQLPLCSRLQSPSPPWPLSLADHRPLLNTSCFLLVLSLHLLHLSVYTRRLGTFRTSVCADKSRVPLISNLGAELELQGRGTGHVPPSAHSSPTFPGAAGTGWTPPPLPVDNEASGLSPPLHVSTHLLHRALTPSPQPPSGTASFQPPPSRTPAL